MKSKKGLVRAAFVLATTGTVGAVIAGVGAAMSNSAVSAKLSNRHLKDDVVSVTWAR